MKARILGLAFAALLATGCATSTYTSGTDFNSANVSRIERGHTTSADLIRLFGKPYSKSVISANQEKWLYSYTAGTATAQNYIVTMNVTTTGTHKMLDVLLQNDVVVNYTFTDGPTPSTVTTN